jgi:hypothetical protein
MVPKHAKSTITGASKGANQVIDLETKFKVIKDYKGEKSVLVIACQSGMSRS